MAESFHSWEFRQGGVVFLHLCLILPHSANQTMTLNKHLSFFLGYPLYLVHWKPCQWTGEVLAQAVLAFMYGGPYTYPRQSPPVGPTPDIATPQKKLAHFWELQNWRLNPTIPSIKSTKNQLQPLEHNVVGIITTQVWWTIQKKFRLQRFGKWTSLPKKISPGKSNSGGPSLFLRMRPKQAGLGQWTSLSPPIMQQNTDGNSN